MTQKKMPEKIEFETTIECHLHRGDYIQIPSKYTVLSEEADRVVWCHLGTKVKVTIEPIKDSLFWWLAKKIEGWAKALMEEKP